MSDKKLQIIIGNDNGKKVRAEAGIASVYAELEKALAGNHWARLVVNELNNLSSGAVNKNYIKVRTQSQGSQVAEGVQELFMDLPCLKATILHGADGSYLVTQLVPNADYFDTNTTSGLYEVTKSGTEWSVKELTDGCIVPDNGNEDRDRVVAISDGNYELPENAATEMATLAAASPNGGGSITGFSDYDIHYTGAGRSFGSYGQLSVKESLNPQADTAIRASAQNLAYTMFQAKDIKGVNWVSINGGSVVLTEAMRILARQGVTLDKHTVYLSNPLSSPYKVLEFAHSMKMIQVREFSIYSWKNLTAIRDQAKCAYKRLLKEQHYYIGNAIADLRYACNSIVGYFAILIFLAVIVVFIMNGSITITDLWSTIKTISIIALAAYFVTKALFGAIEALAPTWWSETRRKWT